MAGLVCQGEVCVFPGGDASATGAEDGPETGDMPVQGAPSVIDIQSEPSSLAEDGSITLTVQVADPDGLDDLVGGQLIDDASDTVLGAFTQISAGTFVGGTDWASVNAAEPIFFELEGTRTLRVEFVDKDENVGALTIDVPYSCGASGFGVCGDGVCRQLNTPASCGACETLCGSCLGGECGPTQSYWSQCFSGTASRDCDVVCRRQGHLGCVEECDGGFGVRSWPDTNLCDEVLAPVRGSCADANTTLAPSQCCCLT